MKHFLTWVLVLALSFGPGAPVLAQSSTEISGQTVVVGDVTFSQVTNGWEIQASDGSIITYDSFGVALNNFVRFIQTDAGGSLSDSARVLNRVTGAFRSEILGDIFANGHVYLVNDAGIFVGPDGSIDANAFHAIAGQLSDDDFLNKTDQFTNLTGTVENQGEINATESAALVGKQVINSGKVNANNDNGWIALVAGNEVLLSQVDSNIVIAVTTTDTIDENLTGVSDTGELTASQVSIAAGDLYGKAIFHGGTIKSKKINIDGKEVGVVDLTGILDASDTSDGATGGTIKIMGEEVDISTRAEILANGAIAGGSVDVTAREEIRIRKSADDMVDEALEIGLNAGDTAMLKGGDISMDQALTLRTKGGGNLQIEGNDVTLGFVQTAGSREEGSGNVSILGDSIALANVDTSGADGIDSGDAADRNGSAAGNIALELSGDQTNGMIKIGIADDGASGSINAAGGRGLTDGDNAGAGGDIKIGGSVEFLVADGVINGGDITMDQADAITTAGGNLDIDGKDVTLGFIQTSGSQEQGSGNVDIRGDTIAVADIRTAGAGGNIDSRNGTDAGSISIGLTGDQPDGSIQIGIDGERSSGALSAAGGSGFVPSTDISGAGGDITIDGSVEFLAPSGVITGGKVMMTNQADTITTNGSPLTITGDKDVTLGFIDTRSNSVGSGNGNVTINGGLKVAVSGIDTSGVDAADLAPENDGDPQTVGTPAGDITINTAGSTISTDDGDKFVPGTITLGSDAPGAGQFIAKGGAGSENGSDGRGGAIRLRDGNVELASDTTFEAQSIDVQSAKSETDVSIDGLDKELTVRAANVNVDGNIDVDRLSITSGQEGVLAETQVGNTIKAIGGDMILDTNLEFTDQSKDHIVNAGDNTIKFTGSEIEGGSKKTTIDSDFELGEVMNEDGDLVGTKLRMNVNEVVFKKSITTVRNDAELAVTAVENATFNGDVSTGARLQVSTQTGDIALGATVANVNADDIEFDAGTGTSTDTDSVVNLGTAQFGNADGSTRPDRFAMTQSAAIGGTDNTLILDRGRFIGDSVDGMDYEIRSRESTVTFADADRARVMDSRLTLDGKTVNVGINDDQALELESLNVVNHGGDLVADFHVKADEIAFEAGDGRDGASRGAIVDFRDNSLLQNRAGDDVPMEVSIEQEADLLGNKLRDALGAGADVTGMGLALNSTEGSVSVTGDHLPDVTGTKLELTAAQTIDISTDLVVDTLKVFSGNDFTLTHNVTATGEVTEDVLHTVDLESNEALSIKGGADGVESIVALGVRLAAGAGSTDTRENVSVGDSVNFFGANRFTLEQDGAIGGDTPDGGDVPTAILERSRFFSGVDGLDYTLKSRQGAVNLNRADIRRVEGSRLTLDGTSTLIDGLLEDGGVVESIDDVDRVLVIESLDVKGDTGLTSSILATGDHMTFEKDLSLVGVDVELRDEEGTPITTVEPDQFLSALNGDLTVKGFIAKRTSAAGEGAIVLEAKNVDVDSIGNSGNDVVILGTDSVSVGDISTSTSEIGKNGGNVGIGAGSAASDAIQLKGNIDTRGGAGRDATDSTEKVDEGVDGFVAIGGNVEIQDKIKIDGGEIGFSGPITTSDASNSLAVEGSRQVSFAGDISTGSQFIAKAGTGVTGDLKFGTDVNNIVAENIQLSAGDGEVVDAATPRQKIVFEGGSPVFSRDLHGEKKAPNTVEFTQEAAIDSSMGTKLPDFGSNDIDGMSLTLRSTVESVTVDTDTDSDKILQRTRLTLGGNEALAGNVVTINGDAALDVETLNLEGNAKFNTGLNVDGDLAATSDVDLSGQSATVGANIRMNGERSQTLTADTLRLNGESIAKTKANVIPAGDDNDPPEMREGDLTLDIENLILGPSADEVNDAVNPVDAVNQSITVADGSLFLEKNVSKEIGDLTLGASKEVMFADSADNVEGVAAQTEKGTLTIDGDYSVKGTVEAQGGDLILDGHGTFRDAGSRNIKADDGKLLMGGATITGGGLTVSGKDGVETKGEFNLEEGDFVAKSKLDSVDDTTIKTNIATFESTIGGTADLIVDASKSATFFDDVDMASGRFGIDAEEGILFEEGVDKVSAGSVALNKSREGRKEKATIFHDGDIEIEAKSGNVEIGDDETTVIAGDLKVKSAGETQLSTMAALSIDVESGLTRFANDSRVVANRQTYSGEVAPGLRTEFATPTATEVSDTLVRDGIRLRQLGQGVPPLTREQLRERTVPATFGPARTDGIARQSRFDVGGLALPTPEATGVQNLMSITDRPIWADELLSFLDEGARLREEVGPEGILPEVGASPNYDVDRTGSELDPRLKSPPMQRAVELYWALFRPMRSIDPETGETSSQDRRDEIRGRFSRAILDYQEANAGVTPSGEELARVLKQDPKYGAALADLSRLNRLIKTLNDAHMLTDQHEIVESSVLSLAKPDGLSDAAFAAAVAAAQ